MNPAQVLTCVLACAFDSLQLLVCAHCRQIPLVDIDLNWQYLGIHELLESKNHFNENKSWHLEGPKACSHYLPLTIGRSYG